MRLAIVSQEYPPETGFGGIGTQNHAKAHGLAARGHQVHVLSHSWDESIHEYFDGQVQVIRIPGPDSDLPIATEEARWITYSAKVAAAIQALHLQESLDLVEFADWGSEGFIHLLNQADWNHLPTIVHLHGPIVMFAHAIGWPDPNSNFYRTARMMEETCVRRADAVFSSSRCSAEWCERFYGLDSRNVPMIHTGVDTTVFYPRNVPKEADPTIIFVGKIEKNKGVDLLVDVACELAHEIPDLRLRLLGRGDPVLARELERRAQQSGFPKLIELVGYVEHSQLPDQLSRAHVFAAPSEYEGGPGFVYLEAMACGLPVVACSGSGASEIIRTGETGLLVPPRDRQSLLQGLRQLFTDRGYLERLGQQAIDCVTREHGRETCLSRLEEFYASVVAHRRPQGATIECR